MVYPPYVNQPVVLWKTVYRPGAYRDQFDRAHTASIILEEIRAVIIDVNRTNRPLPGLRARAENGRIFRNNWDGAEDSHLYPRRLWKHEGEGKILIGGYPVEYELAMIAYNQSLCLTRGGRERPIPLDCTHCEVHDRVYPIHSIGGCPSCEQEKQRKNNLPPPPRKRYHIITRPIADG